MYILNGEWKQTENEITWFFVERNYVNIINEKWLLESKFIRFKLVRKNVVMRSRFHTLLQFLCYKVAVCWHSSGDAQSLPNVGWDWEGSMCNHLPTPIQKLKKTLMKVYNLVNVNNGSLFWYRFTFHILVISGCC